MALEAIIPKILDTPAKKREWLDVCDRIKKQVGYVRFYRHEVTLARKALAKAEKDLKGLRELKAYIEQGKPRKPRPIGYTKFEKEE